MSINRKNLLKALVLGSICLLLAGCTEAGGQNFQSMLVNLSRSYPDLWRLLTATAYILGFAMALRALFYLKVYGVMRTMTSSQSSIKTPVALLFASTMLIASPTAFNVVNMTFFGTASPLSYTGGAVGSFSQSSMIAVIGVVQIIGLIAFIKGWLLVARAGEGQGQPGAIGKALTHIVGGAFAINIVQLKDVVWNTFGFG